MMRGLLFLFLLLAPLCAGAAEDSDTELSARTGSYSEEMTLGDLFGDQFSRRLAEIMPLDTSVSFEVHVPPAYDPSQPPALLAYISPVRTGVPPEAWVEKIDKLNLIWVSVNKSGNSRSTRRRIIETLACVEFVRQRYVTDPTRSYVAGLSGGGRAASIVARTYPDIFNGAIYIVGVDPLGEIAPDKLEKMKDNRFVFLTGSSDVNRKETELVYRRYKKVGLERSKLIVVSGMGHRMPDARWFEESVSFLDSFLRQDLLTGKAGGEN